MTQIALRYERWLSEKSDARQGGKLAKLKPMSRGRAWADTLVVTPDDGALDLTAGQFTLSIGTAPMDGVAKLFEAVVGAVTDNGNGSFNIPVSVTATNTGTIPDDDDGDGVLWLYWDLAFAPSGSEDEDIMAGIIPVTGRVGDA